MYVQYERIVNVMWCYPRLFICIELQQAKQAVKCEYSW